MGQDAVIELPPTPPPKSPYTTPPKTPPAAPMAPVSKPVPTAAVDKTLSSAANLVKLLPSVTVLAFQALSPSFTNKGQCYSSNRALTWALILACCLSSLFFSLTDSVRGTDGKVYYGMATFRGFRLFNFDGTKEEETEMYHDLQLERKKLRLLDFVHAVFSTLVFLALTFGDSEVQKCLFPDAGANAKELLVNLPLGAAVVSSLAFMVFPTSRKGIGYTDSNP